MELELNVKKFSKIKQNLIFSLKVLVWLVMLGTGISMMITESIFLKLTAGLLLGAGFAHGVELQHQALHMTGFTSRLMNRLVGTLLGIPMLVSFCEYRDSHLYHHQKLGTQYDSEFFDYGERESPKIEAIIKHFFLINHFSCFVKKIIDAIVFNTMHTKLSTRNAKSIRIDYFLLGAIFFGTYFICAQFAVSSYFVESWLLPLFLVAAPIHALVELPEHYGCNRTTKDVFHNTRSIKASAFTTWFTNGNNYHVEHHWKAALPIEQLKNVHTQIEYKILNLSNSYFEFYKGFVKDLFVDKKEQKA